MNIKKEHHETCFTILPKHCNATNKVIFGGEAMSALDIACAELVRKNLYNHPVANDSVTHKFEVTFHCPPYMGDIVNIKCSVKEAKGRHFLIEINADVERKKTGLIERFATGTAVFICRNDVENKFVEHGFLKEK